MFRKILYFAAVFAFTTSFSFPQKTSEVIPAQNDKQKSEVVSTETVDSVVKLIEGKVVVVDQGDFVRVETKDGKNFSILMQGIDAPEVSQEYGDKSRKRLADLILGKTVQVIVYKKDSNERYLGTIYFAGKDINLKQIETGSAWHSTQSGFEQRGDDRRIYEQAEQKARAEHTGLWNDKNPVPPWDFRGDRKAEESVEKNTIESQKISPAASDKTDVKAATTSNPKNPADKNKTYTRGPRGGCYYINSNGGKTYVDRSLCN